LVPWCLCGKMPEWLLKKVISLGLGDPILPRNFLLSHIFWVTFRSAAFEILMK
jgi:hypothetical protein